jgi:hypothetical protein
VLQDQQIYLLASFSLSKTFATHLGILAAILVFLLAPELD